MKKLSGLVLVLLAIGVAARFAPPIGAHSPVTNAPPVPTAFERVGAQDLASRIEQTLAERPNLGASRRSAAAKLASLGFNPTEIRTGMALRAKKRVTPERKPAHLLDQLMGIASVSLKAQSTEGELEDVGFIVADAWTDGDDSTWEGTFWGHLDGIDLDFNLSFQVRIPTSLEDGPAELLNNFGGSMNHKARGAVKIDGDLINRAVGFVTLAKVSTKPLEYSSRNLSPTLRVQPCSCSLSGNDLSDCFLQNVLGESWEACAVASIGCAFGGPGWVACVAGWCGGSIVVNLAQELWDFGWRCFFVPE